MLFSANRKQLRQYYFDTWAKFQQQQPLTPFEQQLLSVIQHHPEYHRLLSQPEQYLDKDYLPEFGETNPFLHMSLHMGLLEQLTTNRPAGITAIYRQLCQLADSHHVEHQMLEVLMEMLWQQQRDGRMVLDEAAYLEKLHALL